MDNKNVRLNILHELSVRIELRFCFSLYFLCNTVKSCASRWQVTSWCIWNGGGVTVFSCFQNHSYRIIKKGWNVDLVDISSVWQFIWQQLTTILLVYHLSILRYFQFNEVSQGWRRLRIRMPTDQVPCKTIGISNLHCALHTHMLTNAKSVVTFEIGVIPW